MYCKEERVEWEGGQKLSEKIVKITKKKRKKLECEVEKRRW